MDPDSIQFYQYVYVYWKDVNPEPGVYNWEGIDKVVAEISATPNLGFALWPTVYREKESRSRWYRWNGYPRHEYTNLPNQQESVFPDWVIRDADLQFLPNGTTVTWDPGSRFLEIFEEYLTALAERYKHHPRFAGVECRYHGGAGEGGIGDIKLAELEKDYSMSPENLERWLKQYIDVYARAFEGFEDKVSLANWEPCIPGVLTKDEDNRYAAPSQRVWQYAVDRGFGGRDGQIEIWNRYLTSGFGMSIDPDGYLHVDENYPPISECRFWMSENENYPDYWGRDRTQFGPHELAPYRWYASSLRLLQMRRTWVTVYGQSPLEWPEISRYVQLSLGKTAATSPDAWCWLREGYAKPYDTGQEHVVKNFERWLVQRDVGPDGMTRPAARVDISQMGQNRAVFEKHEYQARSTHHEAGQTAIYFQAADHWFQESPQKVRLFVTYFDGPGSQWHIDFDTSNGRLQTQDVTAANTMQWQTISWIIPDFICSGGFAEGMDFRIVHISGEDPIVRMVRIVKWE